MSYGDGKGLIIDGSNIIGTIEQAPSDVTVAPWGVSIISTELCDRQYEALAATLQVTPAEITEVQLIAALGLTDSRG